MLTQYLMSTLLGYKLRVHINKALKTRCKAIQAALRKYNEAAKSLNRPQLDWKDISTYDSLAEFDLLQECEVDIRRQPWANMQNRQAAIHHFKLERAQEERRRLDIEIAHLVNWMSHEETQLKSVVEQLHLEGSSLAVAINSLLARRLCQNDIHRARIQKIYALPYYSGIHEPSVDLSGVASESNVQGLGDEHGGGSIVDAELAGPVSVEEDDVTGEELDRVNEFLGGLGSIDSA
jgi:hypothetical protein